MSKLEAGKSWLMYANNTEKCYGCAYCIIGSDENLHHDNGDMMQGEVGALPSSIDSEFRKLPVAINNCYGDPLLQWDDTVRRLSILEEDGHAGPVGIITKSPVTHERANRLAQSSCNLVTLVSISGLPESIEPVSYNKRIEALGNLVNAGVPTIAYLRPIIPGYNDNPELLGKMLKDISERGCRHVCYSGLMGKPDVIAGLEAVTGETIQPPSEYDQWSEGHKLIDPEVRRLIELLTVDNGMYIFKKTSCGVSTALDLGPDYNAHWAKPGKYNCKDCVNLNSCFGNIGRASLVSNQSPLSFIDCPVSIELLDAPDEDCVLGDSGVCIKDCTSCDNMTGSRIVFEGELTLGELGIARWLSGLPTTASSIINSPLVRLG